MPNTRDTSILATFVVPIAKALRLHGVDPMPLLEQSEIDPAHVINADRRINGEQLDTLLRLSIEESGSAAFGLEAAEQIQPATLHALGLAFLASDTVLDGLRRLVRFTHVLSTGVELQLLERGEYIDLVFNMREVVTEDEAHYASVDFALGMVIVMCRMTLGEYVSPIHVEMRRPLPDQPDRWASLLGSKMSFAAERDCMSFVHADIVDQLVTANLELARVNDEQTEAYIESFMNVTTARDVVGKIVEQLPDGPPSQKEVAEALNVSNRTLQRKLKSEGTSFVDLLQDTRLKLAQKYLGQPHRSIVEISYMLGFSEPSTFSRAFKRWTGQAPVDYREALLS
jgi:AraC-like DNA-binding protein